MTMLVKTLSIAIILLFSHLLPSAQLDSLKQQVQQVAQLPDKLVGKLGDKYGKLDDKLENASSKMLKRMQKQEAKLRSKLARLDSNKAKQLFANSQQYYEGMQKKLKDKTPKLQGLNSYVPKLDSLSTASIFLQKAGGLNGMGNEKLGKLKELSSKLKDVQSSLQGATDIRKSLSERKQQLQEALKQYDFGKQFKNMNKEIYYYQEQLKEYKSILQDEQKLEQKAMSYIRELPAFREFMQENGQLARLFPMGVRGGSSIPGQLDGMLGLPTRASLQNDISQRLGSTGTNPQAFMKQQLQSAQQGMGQLKDKVNSLGGSNADMEMPNFKPNNQKTKPFWKRLEFGVNVQSQKTNTLLPAMTDFALTAGYKLNDKATIGTGMSYKLGWGKDIKHISLSNQGIALRSFLDIKLKGSFWITGGYEKDYLPKLAEKLAAFSVPGLCSSSWQSLGLIGITKKYKLAKKTGNMQVLWDFLSYSQLPRTQAIKFRIGYKL